MNALGWLTAACLVCAGCDRATGPLGPGRPGAAPVTWTEPHAHPTAVGGGLDAAFSQVDTLLAHVEEQASGLARESRDRMTYVEQAAKAVAGKAAGQIRSAKAKARRIVTPAGPSAAQLPAAPPQLIARPDWQRTAADQRLNQALRKSFDRDEGLSAAAREIQLRTTHGRVVLSGIVASEGIKAALLARAKAVAGDANVVDRLEVE